jgi:predicted nucleic acid-binding protein
LEITRTNAVDGMRLIITDVSVLFDLYHLKVIPEFFALDMEICTTLFVYNEIVQLEQIEAFEMFKRTQKLTVLDVSPDEEVHILNFKLKRNLKSMPDKTMLWKALQLKCPLLTCDDKLRKEARDHGIEVHGSIWVLEELLRQNIISASKVMVLFEQLKTINTRLPFGEIDKIIKRMKG